MKIAVVCEHLDRRRGGAETSSLEMSRALADLGHDVVQIVAGPRLAQHDPCRGVRVVECGRGGSTKLARTRAYIEQVDEYCREQSFDIVHAVTPVLSCDVYQPRGGTYQETIERTLARAGNPLTRTVKKIGRLLNRRQRYLLSLERRLLSSRNPPRVAGVSQYVLRQVTAMLPNFPPDRLHVVFNGVDVQPLDENKREELRADLRRELDVNDQTPLILFVAHNFKLKGLRELLQAFAPMTNAPKPPRLAIVGRDDCGPYLRQARRLNVESRVNFIGPAEDMPRCYAAADLLAHPTWYDPCSRVVLEALARGLPVVTTRCNGAAEIIEPDRCGCVIDSPGDVPALAAALRNALNPELQRACRASANEMRERLSMARHARELTALYERILNMR